MEVLRLLVIGQLEDVEGVAIPSLVDLAVQSPRDLSKNPETGRDGDVLLTASSVGDRISVRGGAESGLPEHFPGAHVERTEVPIDVADKNQTA